MSQRARATASQTPAGGPWATARIGSRAAGTPKMRAPASAPSCAQRDRFALCLRVWSRARRAPRASATRLNREKYRACTSVNAFVPLATAVRGVEHCGHRRVQLWPSTGSQCAERRGARCSACAAVVPWCLASRCVQLRGGVQPGYRQRHMEPCPGMLIVGDGSLWYKFFWKLT